LFYKIIDNFIRNANNEDNDRDSDVEEGIGQQVHGIQPPEIPVEAADPLLSPHGQVYEDLGEIHIDPSANMRYSRGFSLNFGQLVVDHFLPIKEFTYFLLLFPMVFLVTVIVVHTNNNLRARQKTYTTQGELVKFLGITLAMALETTRGGVKAFWDDDADLTETIYQHKNYKTRFGMSRHRFQDLRTALAMGAVPVDLVYNNNNNN